MHMFISWQNIVFAQYRYNLRLTHYLGNFVLWFPIRALHTNVSFKLLYYVIIKRRILAKMFVYHLADSQNSLLVHSLIFISTHPGVDFGQNIWLLFWGILQSLSAKFNMSQQLCNNGSHWISSQLTSLSVHIMANKFFGLKFSRIRNNTLVWKKCFNELFY